MCPTAVAAEMNDPGPAQVSRDDNARGFLHTPRPVAALAGTVLVLALWNLLVRPALPSALHVVGGLVVALVMVGMGLWGGVGLRGLGLAIDRLPSGLRYGLCAIAVVTAVVLIGAATPW